MHLSRRLCALVTTVLITTPLVSVVPPASAERGGGGHPHHDTVEDSAQVVLDWERILFKTVYPSTPIPVGVPILGFTSMAMHDAVERSIEAGESSETAAVATAAHVVLSHYYPAQKSVLDAHLATSLASVTDADQRARGGFLGAAAGNLMLASRVGDGYLDTSIHYTLPPAIGIWQPTPPATDMLGAWIGSLDRLVLERPIRVDGPDPLDSRAWAKDYNEVKRLGGTVASGTERTQEQGDIAVFHNGNAATMVSDALVRYLEARPGHLDVHDTALLFASMHAAMTDALIQTWQLKRDVGFWRPFQAIAGADLDGNPRTTAQPGWAPLIPNPPYSDYTSGHASATGSAVEVIRRTLGDHTELELITTIVPAPPVSSRTYATLSDLEFDTFHARIWGGLHYRDAMEDGYRIAHETARKVMREID